MPGIAGQVGQGLAGVVRDVPKGIGEVGKQTIEGVLSAGTLGIANSNGSKKIETDPRMAEIREAEERNKSVAAGRIAQLQSQLEALSRQKAGQKMQEERTEEQKKQQEKQVVENKKKNRIAEWIKRKTKGTGEMTKQVG